MIPVIIIRYGIKVTVWIFDIMNVKLLYSVNVMSWKEYLTKPFPVKPYKIIKTFDKRLAKPIFTKDQRNYIISLIIKTLI